MSGNNKSGVHISASMAWAIGAIIVPAISALIYLLIDFGADIAANRKAIERNEGRIDSISPRADR